MKPKAGDLPALRKFATTGKWGKVHPVTKYRLYRFGWLAMLPQTTGCLPRYEVTPAGWEIVGKLAIDPAVN